MTENGGQGLGDKPRSFDEELHAAFLRMDRLLAVRDRSELELRQRLERAGFSAEVVTSVVSFALDVGYISDERFAHAFVNGKARLGWGRGRIERELRRFGIDALSLEDYPEAFYEDEDDLRRATAVLTRFRTHSKNVREAQYRHLVNKGFSADIAQKALVQLTHSSS